MDGKMAGNSVDPLVVTKEGTMVAHLVVERVVLMVASKELRSAAYSVDVMVVMKVVKKENSKVVYSVVWMDAWKESL